MFISLKTCDFVSDVNVNENCNVYSTFIEHPSQMVVILA